MRKPIDPLGKAAAYLGLIFVLPATCGAGYFGGEYLDRQWGTRYFQVIGMVLGLAAGGWEVYRQVERIERLSSKTPGKNGR
jgi:F0F1-type ATP synthase assembly protein I